MYIDDNDVRSPRDRVSENDLTRYLLQNSDVQDRTRQNDRRNGCSCERSVPTMARETSCPICRGKQSHEQELSSCKGYTVPLGFPLAIVYAPIQEWRGIYDEHKALSRGTLFAELDKPLEVKGRKCR